MAVYTTLGDPSLYAGMTTTVNGTQLTEGNIRKAAKALWDIETNYSVDILYEKALKSIEENILV